MYVRKGKGEGKGREGGKREEREREREGRNKHIHRGKILIWALLQKLSLINTISCKRSLIYS